MSQYNKTVGEKKANAPEFRMNEGVSMQDAVAPPKSNYMYKNRYAKEAIGAIKNMRQTYYDPQSFTGGFKTSYEVGKIDAIHGARYSSPEDRMKTSKNVHANASDSWDDY